MAGITCTCVSCCICQPPIVAELPVDGQAAPTGLPPTPPPAAAPEPSYIPTTPQDTTPSTSNWPAAAAHMPSSDINWSDWALLPPWLASPIGAPFTGRVADPFFGDVIWPPDEQSRVPLEQPFPPPARPLYGG